MTPQQKDLVQSSFEKVLPISEQAAALFYSRLFEVDPSLRPLFKTDIEVQAANTGIGSCCFIPRGFGRR